MSENWLTDKPTRKPFVLMEDELRYIRRVLGLSKNRAPQVIPNLTIVYPEIADDELADDVLGLLREYEGVTIVARVNKAEALAQARTDDDKAAWDRLVELPETCCSPGRKAEREYKQFVSKLIRPGGVLLVDLLLEPLLFLMDEPYSATIEVATDIRDLGFRTSDEPQIWLWSRLTDMGVGFARCTEEARIRGRNCYEKDTPRDDELVTDLGEFLEDRFPWTMRTSAGENHRVGPDDTGSVGRTVGLVVWPERDGRIISDGIILSDELNLDPLENSEVKTWNALLEDAVGDRIGVAADSIAKYHNNPYHHIYTLRHNRLTPSLKLRSGKTLSPNEMIVNANEGYQLTEECIYAIVKKRP